MIPVDRALRTAAARRDLVRAVVEGSRADVEMDWIEWKSSLNLTDRSSIFEIARQILGFANRDPERAARVLEGCAYLLVGVERQRLVGVLPVDSAEIEKKVNQYVGFDGPAWDFSYEQLDGLTVLVITVEPPRFGDPVHVLRREFGSHKSGAVFVRRFGRTDLADADAMRMLSQRAQRQATRIAVALEIVGNVPTIPAVDDRPEGVRRLASSKRERIADGKRPYAQGNKPQTSESSGDGYYAEVARDLVANLASRAPPIQLRLINLTDRNQRAVQVDVRVNGAVSAAYNDPQRSLVNKAYGVTTLGSTVTPFPIIPRLNVLAEGDGLRLLFAEEDLRPRHGVWLEAFRLAASGSLAGGAVTLTWYATATDTDGVSEGQLALPVHDFLTPGVLTDSSPATRHLPERSASRRSKR